MNFWAYSLAIYDVPGVAAACLALQDENGADVNMLLFALWTASLGARLTPEDMRCVDAAVGDWRAGVVQTLRAARRALKVPPAGFDAAALRKTVEQAELEAERLQQLVMATMVPPAITAPSVALARDNLAAYRAGLPDSHVATLVAAWTRTDA